jgi:carboxymethylenebutenolidase
MTDEDLSARQRTMVEVWERHMAAEFATKDVEATMATMTARPVVNHVPVMTGGVGSPQVRQFYSRHFIPGHPPDVETVPVARTVGADRIVDELIYRCTHTIEMPWILPGVRPTGRRIEFAVIVVVQFEDGKIAGSASTGTRRRCSPRWDCSMPGNCRPRGARPRAKSSIPPGSRPTR